VNERHALTTNRNTFWAAVFAQELALGGLTTVCLAPGSRSTPLVLALAARPELTLYTHIDERGAAFFALGHAKASGRPVALLCTSGTAAANFHPAILEAQLSEVPLLVLTADRPPELRGVGAAQTVDQLKLYGGAVKFFAELGTPELTAAALRHLRSLAARALFESARPPAGPVHLNFPFRKPLEPVGGDGDGDVPAALQAEFADSGAAFAHASFAPTPPAADVVQRIARQIREQPRGLIVCGPELGVHPPSRNGAGFPHAVAALARRAGVPILAEPPSQVRGGPHDRTRVIAHGEAILRGEEFRKRLDPQWMIRFGGMPTAKHLEVLLDERPALPVVLVTPGGRWLEPTHHPLTLVAADEVAFCGAMVESLGPGASSDESWLAHWQSADRAAGQALASLFESPEPTGLGDIWSEPRVAWELARLLPDGALQWTASSMPVRDLDAFTSSTAPHMRHLVSRGANGIDGTLSSALGAAAAHAAQADATGGGGPAVLVTGDLAFYHDSNGLLAAKQYGIALTVVLVNNDGGGIFEFLPIADFEPEFEKHFGTPHSIDFAALCAAYGIKHQRPKDWAEFRLMAQASFASGETRVIEIRTDRKANRVHHRRAWEAVAAALERMN
jgi:2-succinyl-5-enolpyruvyl-6-hydroxy-3-cyclohexene-1-carboxylate synthase